MQRCVFGSVALLAMLLCTPTWAADSSRRLLTPDDVNALHEVGDPQLSPDGEWVLHTVRTSDREKDQRNTHVWMTHWSGARSVQLTNSTDSEDTPRWSPDGRYVSFLSSRGGEDAPEQLWLMDRGGGEARVATSFKGDVLDYAWSPDGRQIALIVMDEDPAAKATAKDKTPPPIVIDRYYFKEDETGYLGALRKHLYVLDVATGKTDSLTPGKFDEAWPIWSPDGSQIAFISKRGPDPDRSNDNGLYVIAPRAGSEPRLLTTFHGDAGDSGWMTTPSWRPDGREIALAAARDPKLIYYARQDLMIVNAVSGATRLVTSGIDRNVIYPHWSPDGKSIYGFIEDDRNQYLTRIRPGDEQIRSAARRPPGNDCVRCGREESHRDSRQHCGSPR